MDEEVSINTLDEQGGFFYEALLSYTITNLCNKIGDYEIHKRLMPNAVVSDVIIPSAASPRAVILCTHSHATSGTHMKSWRNIDEMLMLRENFPKCCIINLIFPSEWKPELLLIMKEICDYQITFPIELEINVLELASDAIDQHIRSAEGYLCWLKDYDADILEPIASYLAKILDTIFEKRPVVNKKWRKYADSVTHKATLFNDYHRDCAFKRGMNKLSLISEANREELWKHKNEPKKIPESTVIVLRKYQILNIEKDVVTKYIIDPDVQFVLSFDKSFVFRVFEIVNQYHCDDWYKLTAMVREDNGLDFSDFSTIFTTMTAEEVEEHLFQLLTEWNVFHPNKRNIPLDYLYVIAKRINRRFSHKVLSDYCGLPMIGGVSPIPQFLYGTGSLSEETIRMIASYFSRMITPETIPDVNDIWDQMLHETLDKLIKHIYVNFLLYAVILKCIDCGLSIENTNKPSFTIGNGIAKYCIEILKNGVTNSTAQTDFSFVVNYRDTEVVFLVISAYSATHKHKEYPARWRCSRIEYENGTFIQSNQSRKWIIVLDGSWSVLFSDFQDVLGKFRSAGADAIFDSKHFLQMDNVISILDSVIDPKV